MDIYPTVETSKVALNTLSPYKIGILYLLNSNHEQFPSHVII